MFRRHNVKGTQETVVVHNFIAFEMKMGKLFYEKFVERFFNLLVPREI